MCAGQASFSRRYVSCIIDSNRKLFNILRHNPIPPAICRPSCFDTPCSGVRILGQGGSRHNRSIYNQPAGNAVSLR